jgi:peroxin-1
MLCRIFVSCSKLALEKVPIIRQELANHITEALNHAPSVVIFDDLDGIISTSDSEGSQPSMSVAGLTDFLVNIMDEYGVRSIPLVLCAADSLKCYACYCSL